MGKSTPSRNARRAAKKQAIDHVPVVKKEPLGPGGDCCRNCRFFAVAKDEKRAELEQAVCVRFPPQVVPHYTQTPMGAMPSGQNSSAFPVMNWFGWCGEHAFVAEK